MIALVPVGRGSSRAASAQTFDDQFDNALAAIVSRLIGILPLLTAQSVTQAVKMVEAQACYVRSCKRDGAFGYQAHTERNLADQFPRQRPPAKRARDDACDLTLLNGIAYGFIAGRRDQEGHPDLVDRQKSGVTGELADGPGQIDDAGNDVRQRCNYGEQSVVPSNRMNHVIDDRLAKRIKISRESDAKLRPLFED